MNAQASQIVFTALLTQFQSTGGYHEELKAQFTANPVVTGVLDYFPIGASGSTGTMLVQAAGITLFSKFLFAGYVNVSPNGGYDYFGFGSDRGIHEYTFTSTEATLFLTDGGLNDGFGTAFSSDDWPTSSTDFSPFFAGNATPFLHVFSIIFAEDVDTFQASRFISYGHFTSMAIRDDVAVPEPSALALLLIGLIGLACFRQMIAIFRFSLRE